MENQKTEKEIINDKIHDWMCEGKFLGDLRRDYYRSLDAMRWAEERLSGPMKADYVRRIGLAVDTRTRAGIATPWQWLTAPAHIRAEALVEVLDEVG